MPIQQQYIEQFSPFELLAKQVVEGFITGLHKSPFHGFSVEFAEHRLYNKGESTKHIDWKLFARSEKLFIKRYEEETNLRCQIIIDTSSSMFYPESKNDNIKNLNKIGFSAYVAAALILLVQKQSDAFGLTLFDEKISFTSQAKSNNMHRKFIFNKLEEILAGEKNQTQTKADRAIKQISESIHKRSLVVIFSDLMNGEDGNEKLFRSMQNLKHNKHEIILFHVTDFEKEIMLNFDNSPHIFIDKETNKEIKVNPENIKENYQKKALAFMHEAKLRCGQLGIDYCQADIGKGLNAILTQFLIKRAGMTK